MKPLSLIVPFVLLGLLACWMWLQNYSSMSSNLNQSDIINTAQINLDAMIEPLSERKSLSTSAQEQLTVRKFALTSDKKLLFLRQSLMRPWREVNTEADAFKQQSAMSDLSRMRTPEAANILAELLFANHQDFFAIEYIDGIKIKSVSYSVMIYLYKMLDGSPMPIDGKNYADSDLIVWKKWWNANHNKLVFRDPKKPIPLPPGLRN